MHLHGKYETTLPSVIFEKKVEEEETKESVAPQPINITYGYSRDHRPDLKQFILNLICSSDGDVPLFLKTASGNESDQKVFAQIAVGFKKQIDFDTLMIADSALYSAANIALMKDLKWLCRVPLTVGYAKQVISELPESKFNKSEIDGYSFVVKTSNYGGIEQRWLVVESEQRIESDVKQLEKRISRAKKTQQQKLEKLSIEEFACHQDAMKAVDKFSKQVKYHKLINIKIIKKASKLSHKSSQSSEKLNHDCYHVTANLERDESIIEWEKQSAGRFVLATNVLDEAILGNSEMISDLHCATIMRTGIWFSQRSLVFH